MIRDFEVHLSLPQSFDWRVPPLRRGDSVRGARRERRGVWLTENALCGTEAAADKKSRGFRLVS